ncbi:hypothetical protein ACHAXS_012113 [Conticribra weissflogii]
MSLPPEFIRPMLDGSAESSFVVLENGKIWHVNESARIKFQISCFTDNYIGAYINFFPPQSFRGDEPALTLSWDEMTNAATSEGGRKKANGTGKTTNGEIFPIHATLIKINRSASCEILNGANEERYFYCLYVGDIDPAQLENRQHEEFLTKTVTHVAAPQDVARNNNGESSRKTNGSSIPIENIQLNNEIPDEIFGDESIVRGILDASFHSLFLINQQLIIQKVNKKSCEVFGWSKDEFMGKNFCTIVADGNASTSGNHIDHFVETEIRDMIGQQREVVAIRKDGSTLSCLLGLSECENSDFICGFIRDITIEKVSQLELERKREELESKQLMIRGILDASFHALFVINEQCIIQMVNAKSCEVFGWTNDEFIGKNINMIMPDDISSHHDEYVKHYLETGVRKMIGTQREVTAKRKDGSTFTCRLGLSETKESGLICGFIRDLTSEKAAEAAIAHEQQLLTKILDASFDALLVIDERGIIQKVNSAATTVFGWSEAEFLGNSINIIMSEDEGKKHDIYLERYCRTGHKKMIGKQRELEARKKDGSLFPCTIGLTEVHHMGSRKFVGFIKDVTVQKSLLIAEAERQASDNLLHNILPEHIANRLKQDPSHIADHYDNTTILFADIVGFTDKTSRMSPHDIVSMLNDLFSRFDYLVGRYDLNKVKTIGDCYMATSIPSDELEHDGCARVCRFALDLLQAVKAFNDAGPRHGHVSLRVGIATGQVVAGVLGTKRFLFDMWGDAVNVAARMEQHGVPNQIQVTERVVENAGPEFTFEFRGTLNVKGKGPMGAYFLKSAKGVCSRLSVKELAPVRKEPKPARCRSTVI